MLRFTFSVKASENADKSHEVTVTLPDFDEATEAQRRVAWQFMAASSSPRVRIQSALRNALGNGATQKDVQELAQSALDDLVNGRSVRAAAEKVTVIDASTFPGGLTQEQKDALEATGAIVVNWEEPSEEK